jgi:predicted MFS family arabinose efflux permease
VLLPRWRVCGAGALAVQEAGFRRGQRDQRRLVGGGLVDWLGVEQEPEQDRRDQCSEHLARVGVSGKLAALDGPRDDRGGPPETVVRTDQYAWGSPQTLLPLAVAVAAGAAFTLYEQCVAAAPLVRLGILRDRQLLIACTVILCIAAGQFGAFYFASLYLQGILGYTPLATGLAFVPLSLGVITGTIAASRLIPRLGPRRTLLGGLVLAAAGVAWFGQVGPHATFTSAVLGPSVLASLGLGLCFVTVAATATSNVAPAEAGLASGLINTCRQCGGSIGLAALVTVAGSATHHRAAGPELPSAITAGYDQAFLAAGTLIAISAVLVFLFLRGTPASAAPAPDNDV